MTSNNKNCWYYTSALCFGLCMSRVMIAPRRFARRRRSSQLGTWHRQNTWTSLKLRCRFGRARGTARVEGREIFRRQRKPLDNLLHAVLSTEDSQFSLLTVFMWTFEQWSLNRSIQERCESARLEIGARLSPGEKNREDWHQGYDIQWPTRSLPENFSYGDIRTGGLFNCAAHVIGMAYRRRCCHCRLACLPRLKLHWVHMPHSTPFQALG